MNAWQRLLVASSLAIGTAWDLIAHPKTGGSGVVVNNGIAIALADGAVSVAVADSPVAVVISDAAFDVTVHDPQYTIVVEASRINIELDVI